MSEPRRWGAARLTPFVVAGLALSAVLSAAPSSRAAENAGAPAFSATRSGIPHRSIFVDIRTVDISRRETRERILRQPVDRLIVPLLIGGRTPLALPSFPFAQIRPRTTSAIAGSRRQPGRSAAASLALPYDDGLTKLIQEAKARHISVYGFVDCLHWKTLDAAPAEDPFVKHPGLAEKDDVGRCGLPSDGTYASPFNPEVASLLVRFVRLSKQQCPHLDGLVLECHLPISTLLGYSDAARLNYISAHGIDPIDLPLYGSPDQMKDVMTWVEWRRQATATLVHQMSAAFREGAPNAPIAAIGRADYYRLQTGVQNTLLEDWLSWLTVGDVSEVILETDIKGPKSPDYLSAVDLLNRAHVAGRQSVVVTEPSASSEGHSAGSSLAAGETEPAPTVELITSVSQLSPRSAVTNITSGEKMP